MNNRRSEPPDLHDELEAVLTEQGVRGVLARLNAGAPHRFTGLYLFDPPTLRNLCLFDQENPSLQLGSDVPMQETYCSITGRTAAPFSTPDARADDRLDEHPARESTLSYCGVPLLDASGHALGTLCHFDLVARTVPASETPTMRAAAELLVDELRRAGRIPP